MLSPSEKNMWNDAPRQKRKESFTIHEINEKYEKGEHRIVTETNREKLPNFVDALRRNDYMEIRPFYQRRSRWDEERQSKLIESFIINIPVPPIFLYEKAYNSYEVMDGQQRITAIDDFYNNRLALTGLDLWPELNGMTYSELPNKIRAGLDRRSISSIVLLKESAPNDEDALFLRQLVFERLNTGGVKLEKQEIRNSLGSGPFNDMLFKLARLNQFRQAWELPLFSEEELANHKLPIYEKSFFRNMEDVEVVLRFFALRHIEYFRYGIQGFLDLYMVRSRNFTQDDCQILGSLFERTLELACEIFGENVFRVPNESTYNRPLKGLYDAVMVPLTKFLDRKDELIARRIRVIELTNSLIKSEGIKTFTGQGNTRKDLENRLKLFENLYSEVLS